jgi:flavin reductase (DIM6/NTAB) family NADH-FMN oxidoreductase RutF
MSYNPIFRYPNDKTGFFKGEKVGTKLFKNVKDVDQSAYGGWWPTFFPTTLSLLVTGDKKKYNVMSVSCVVVVNAHPFMIGMPIFTGEKSTHGVGPRYSLELLQANPEYTINLPYIDEEMTKKVLICGSLSGRGVDKFAKAGLTTMPSRHIDPPIIVECPLNIECRVHSMTRLGTHYWIMGNVLAVYLDESVSTGRNHLVWRSLPELEKGEVIDKKHLCCNDM